MTKRPFPRGSIFKEKKKERRKSKNFYFSRGFSIRTEQELPSFQGLEKIRIGDSPIGSNNPIGRT